MRIRAVYTRWVLIMLATALLLAFVAMTPRYSTADTISCAGGGTSHAATVDEAAAANPAGSIVAGVTQVCPSDTKLGINNQSGAAKLDLNKMTCNAGVNISSLDNKFSICADKFMQQLRAASPGACITSAYRSVQQQAAACVHICGLSGATYGCPGTCAIPGKSYHQKGLAIDVSFNSISDSEAWQLAISSTNGGLLNPSGLHSSDPHHFQASGSDCSLGGVATSTQTDTYTPSATTVSSGQTASTVTAACTAQFSCSGMILLYTNSSCQQQTVQYCQYGCLGNACASQSQSSSGTTGTTQTSSGTSGSSGSSGTTYTAGSGCTSYQPTSDQSVAASNKCYYYTGGGSTTGTQSSSLLTTSGSSTTGSSAIDLLNILAGSTTSASSGTTSSTPIALNNNLGQSSDISPTSPGTANSDGISVVSGSGYDSGSGDVTHSGSSSTQAQNTSASQSGVNTFTSGDLSNNGSFATTSTNATFMARALSELNVLKAQLVSAISFLGQYLKPFGGISIPDEG